MPRACPHLAAIAVTLILASPLAPASDTPVGVAEQDVLVRKSGSQFTVDVTMHTPATPSTAWAVLTDFEHMANFIPNLTTSEIIERHDARLIVRQRGTARYGVFSTDFESLREIRLTPRHEIHAHGLGGNIRQLESLMRLEPDGGGTRLRYHSEAQPDFWLPPMIGPAVIRHETAEQFSAMLREMQRRQDKARPAAEAP